MRRILLLLCLLASAMGASASYDIFYIGTNFDTQFTPQYGQKILVTPLFFSNSIAPLQPRMYTCGAIGSTYPAGFPISNMLSGKYVFDVQSTPRSTPQIFTIGDGTGAYTLTKADIVLTAAGTGFPSYHDLTNYIAAHSSSGSATNLTPWTSDINGGGFSLTNANSVKSDIAVVRSLAANGNATFANHGNAGSPLVVDEFTGTNALAQLYNTVNGRQAIISSNADITIGAGVFSGDGSGLTNVTGSAVSSSKSIFVSTGGNDSTALRERLDRPFATLSGANAVALSGDTIFIKPGTYVCNQISVPMGVAIVGSGRYGTTLRCVTNAVISWFIDLKDSCSLSDLTVRIPTNNTQVIHPLLLSTGITNAVRVSRCSIFGITDGLTYSMSLGLPGNCVVQDCYFDTMFDCFNLNGGSNSTASSMYVFGSTLYGHSNTVSGDLRGIALGSSKPVYLVGSTIVMQPAGPNIVNSIGVYGNNVHILGSSITADNPVQSVTIPTVEGSYLSLISGYSPNYSSTPWRTRGGSFWIPHNELGFMANTIYLTNTAAMQTNTVVVTLAGTAAANGTYKFKSTNSLSSIVWTNTLDSTYTYEYTAGGGDSGDQYEIIHSASTLYGGSGADGSVWDIDNGAAPGPVANWYAPPLALAGITNIYGSLTVGGTMAGNGSGLTNLNASQLKSGTVDTARLGSGTANSSTFLRGDQTYATPAGSGDAVQAGNNVWTGSNFFSGPFVISNGTATTSVSNLDATGWTRLRGVVTNDNLTASMLVGSDANKALASVNLSGDVTTSSGLATTMKNTGTAGTYTSVTFDAQGRETSGSNPALATAYPGAVTNWDTRALVFTNNFGVSNQTFGAGVSLGTNGNIAFSGTLTGNGDHLTTLQITNLVSTVFAMGSDSNQITLNKELWSRQLTGAGQLSNVTGTGWATLVLSNSTATATNFYFTNAIWRPIGASTTNFAPAGVLSIPAGKVAYATIDNRWGFTAYWVTLQQ